LSQDRIARTTDPRVVVKLPRKALNTLSQFYLYPETDTGREVEKPRAQR